MSAGLQLLADIERRVPQSIARVGDHEWPYFDTAASGPVMVMLPGSVGTGAMFYRAMHALGDRVRMIAVSYPALSDPRALARGLAELFDFLGLRSAHVVGSSFGAYWAQFFALAHPARVQSLLLGNGFVDATDLAEHPLFRRDWVEAAGADEILRTWLERAEAAPLSELRDVQLAMLGSRQSAANLASRFQGVVRAIACPPLPLRADRITILDCDDDPLITPAARVRVRAAYPGARHVSLPHGAHYPHIINPQAYAKLLGDIAGL